MTNPNFADEQEAPLDPAFEKVRRKMVRLLIISSSVIILGLMAVVYSIVYRVNRIPQPANSVVATPAAPDVTPAAQTSCRSIGARSVLPTSVDSGRAEMTCVVR